jgi:glycosyltransferase involved in cell wall biosynthesis
VITFVMPFVTDDEFLQPAIESALLLRGDWRLNVCDNARDDAVRDRVRDLVESYADPRVRFVRFAEHVPMSRSFNRAIETAQTDLVSILHSDDRVLPDYVEVMEALATGHPEAAVFFCATRIIDARGKRAFSFVDFSKRFFRPAGSNVVLRGETGVRDIMRGNFIMAPTACFRRSKLGPARWPEDLHMALDIELWTRILFEGGTLVSTAAVAYEYRRHEEQSTVKFNRSLFRYEEEAATYDLIARRARERGWTDAARVATAKRIVRLHLLYDATMDALRLNLRAAVTKLRLVRTLGQ